MSTITLPEPHSYWRNTDSNQIVVVIGYHVEPPQVGRKPTVLVQYRYGVHPANVTLFDGRLWTIDYEPASQGDWIKQEAG